MSQYIVSARKYRPDSFETLIGQDNIARTLKNSILRGQLAHAYLFCGPRGVGKTSTARIFAKMINCSNPSEDMVPCGECESCVSFSEGRSYCIHELDAASNNGVDDIKALMDQVQIPPQVGKYSVYIIDEVHMLSSAAFNAFLKTLEEPPAHAIFILATTEKHKILPTILSRCQTYDFNRISISDMILNLRSIAQKENISIDDESLHVISQKADGAMRDALTIFDQTVAFCGTDVKYEDVIRNLNVLDYEYSFRLVDAFLRADYATAMLVFDEVLSKGFNAQHFISALSSHLRDLIVSCTAGLDALLDMPASLKQRYKAQSDACSLQFLYDGLNVTTQCEAGYKSALNQRLHIEFALMKLAFLGKGVPSRPAVAPVETPAPAPASVPVKEAVPPPVPDPVPAAPAPSAAETPAAAVAPAPVAAPAQPQTSVSVPEQQASSAPAPRRRAVKTGASLSLNSLMKEKEEVEVVEKVADKTAVIEFNDEYVAEKWKSLAAMYPSQPRLQNALANARLELSEEDGVRTVTFTVTNEAQKKWIAANLLHDLEGRFQKLAACPVRLLVEAAQYVEEKVIYTPEDKIKALMESEPEVIDLVKDLGLDLK